MSRRAWIVFWIWQGTAAIAGEIWPFTMVSSRLVSGFGVACWVIDCYLRLPGNVLSALLIQKFLWMKPLTHLELGVIDLALTVLFNLALWLAIAAVYRTIRNRSRRRKMV